MKTFEYRGFDRAGRSRRGIVEASHTKEARERLAERGVLVQRIEATGRQLPFPPDVRAAVYRELGSLLAAGLPLMKAFDILLESAPSEAAGSILAAVRDRVREGAPLGAAFAEAGPAVSPFERAIMEAAERAATMEAVLERLAGFLEEQEKLKERIRDALTYPAIVFGFGVCVAAVMLGVLLPRAHQLLGQAQAAMPWLTRAMMAVGRGVAAWGAAAAVAAVAGAFWFRRRLARSEDLRHRMDRLAFRLPIAGRARRLLVSLRFTRTLAILLRGGVPVVASVRLAGRATGSPWVESLAQAGAAAVEHGRPLSEAVREMPPLAASLPGWIQVGEAGGGLDRLLDRAATVYQDQWERFMQRLLRLIEPALILLIGGFVLLVTLSILLPVISLTQTLVK